MPVQKIELSERERQALEYVAESMGMSPEAAASLLVQERLARGMKKKTGTAVVLPFPRRQECTPV